MPLLSSRPETIPVPLGLLALPVAAVMCTGYRAGLVWTGLVAGAFLIGAGMLPSEPGVRVLASNAAIVAAIRPHGEPLWEAMPAQRRFPEDDWTPPADCLTIRSTGAENYNDPWRP